MSTKGKARLNVLWTDRNELPDLADWVERYEKNNNTAFCKFCCKIIELSNIGKNALVSHANEKIHRTAA